MRLIDAHMSLCNNTHLHGVVQIANAENAHAKKRKTEEGFQNGIKKETMKKVEKKNEKKFLESFPFHSPFTIRNSLNITAM